MRVSDIMQANVIAIRHDARVADAVTLLADAHVSGLPVLDDKGALVGAISSSDVLLAEAEHDTAEGREALFQETAVEELMTPRPLTIAPDVEVKEAARQMLYADVHRLFVVLDDQVVGVISRSDIARVWATAR